MCGDYNSIIGMEAEEPMRRFVTGMPRGRFTPAMGEATLAGLFVETDDRTGKATRIIPVRQGGHLPESSP
jgi:calcineurin-like phosphoesterase